MHVYYKLKNNLMQLNLIYKGILGDDDFLNDFFNKMEQYYYIMLIKTKEKIDIDKKQKIKLKKYLKERKISIKYFENFEGYIFTHTAYMCENSLVKGIYIQFINNNYKNKNKFIFCTNKEDIENLLIILNYFLKDIEKVKLDKSDIISLFMKQYLKFSDLFIYKTNIQTVKNSEQFFVEYLRLINFINNIDFNKLKNKKYIYLETKENLNIKELDNFLLENLLYYKKKEYFLNFKGYIFLSEIELSSPHLTMPLKNLVIWFININDISGFDNNFYIILENKNLIKYVFYLVQLMLIEKNIYNELTNEDMERFLNYNYEISDSFYKFVINKQNRYFLTLNNFEIFIFYLQFYALFI